MAVLIDLSHPIRDGMRPYPGLFAPRIGAVLDHAASRSRYSGDAEFYLGRVEMPGNVGTYLDSPFHRYPDGADLSRIPLERLAGLPGLIIDRPAESRVAIDIEAPAEALRGRAVLVRTGWAKRWDSDAYWEPGPYLSAAALDRLVEAPAALVGVDFWNVDNTDDLSRPAHSRLLAAGILIVEHLASLDGLPGKGFRFWAVPPPIVRGASFPVRAFAEVG
jgi:arylformamidase